MTQEALKLALEALKMYGKRHRATYLLGGAWDEEITLGDKAITFIKEALAQTQDPVKYSDYEPDGVHHNKPKQDTIQRLSALVRTQQITIDKLEAQTQEPVAWPCLIDSADFSENTITLVMQCEDYKVSAGTHWLSTTPPQRTEQNFCSRCGKRTTDLTTIHTCTPPQENT